MQLLKCYKTIYWKYCSNLCFTFLLLCLLLSCSDGTSGNNSTGKSIDSCGSYVDAFFLCYFDVSDFNSAGIIKYRADSRFRDTLSIKEVSIVSKSLKEKFANGPSDSVEYWILKFADSVNMNEDFEVVFQDASFFKSNKFSMIKYGQLEANDGYDCVLFSYLHNGTEYETKTFFLLK